MQEVQGMGAVEGNIHNHIFHLHVKFPPLGMIFSIIMREEVSESQALGSILTDWVGLVFASLCSTHACFSKHPASTFLQHMLLKRHRILASFSL